MSRLRGTATRRRVGGQARAEERAAYAFLTPWLIGIVVFLLIPLVYSVWISLTDEQLLRQGAFVGLDNYVTILGGGDPYFWKAMQVTFSWVLLTVPAVHDHGPRHRAAAEPEAAGDARLPHAPVHPGRPVGGGRRRPVVRAPQRRVRGREPAAARDRHREPAVLVRGSELGDAGPRDRGPVGDRRQRRDLPRRAPEHPAAPVRGGVDRRRRGAREVPPDHPADALAHAVLRAHQLARRCAARVPGRGVRHLRRDVPGRPGRLAPVRHVLHLPQGVHRGAHGLWLGGRLAAHDLRLHRRVRRASASRSGSCTTRPSRWPAAFASRAPAGRPTARRCTSCSSRSRCSSCCRSGGCSRHPSSRTRQRSSPSRRSSSRPSTGSGATSSRR